MTKKYDDKSATIEELERMLDTFGADRARWPAKERLKYSALIGASARARRLVSEAEALESVLDAAPLPSAGDVDALAARIMAAAVGQATAPGNVVTTIRPRGSAPSPRKATDDRLLGWPAAALLAASLVLGVFTGTTGLVDEPLQSIARLAVEPSEADDDASRLAFDADDSALTGEEML